MCGENEEILYDRRYVGGSPPRVRGKLVLARVLSRIGRITPACAGKTEFYGIALAWYEDHPRVCGENFSYRNILSVPNGSPPRVRGKHAGTYHRQSPQGITPACAGKTILSRPSKRPSEDHPRVCGENFLNFLPIKFFTGSPPRVRGKRRDKACADLRPRITPACAGKTVSGKPRSAQREDHPRVCGENLSISSCSFRVLGSPPRVRGKRVSLSACTVQDRITPACAGKTAGVS